ncbi:MAG: CPBP family intramembrane metalloprotease [Clostridiaceae bacterium]|nr:CPBP family intramembrane metalloprotease [Clostridiaceae bacterium]
MIKIIINYGIFLIMYIVPLIVFIFYSLKNSLNRSLIVVVSSIYLLLSLTFSKVSYNLFPFMMVIYVIILISKKEKGIFDTKGFNILKAFKYAIFSYFISSIISFIYIIILIGLNFKISDQKIINKMLDLPINKFIIMVPIIILFAPVVEEFVFRWFLYNKFLKKYIGIYWGAILSSAFFSVVHFNLKSFAVIMTLGFINCWLINNKGYWYAVFNHVFFNCVSVIILLLNKFT